MRFYLVCLSVTLFYCSTGSTQCISNDILAVNKLNENQLLTRLEVLSSDSFAGRKFASKENIQVQQYLITQLQAANISPFKGQYLHSFEHEQMFSTKQGANIIGLIKGRLHPEKYIVLTAHYDHLGKKGSKFFPGADDNASGVSSLLAFGEALSLNPLNHSVILLFTDGEEVSLLGAKYFVKQQEQLLKDIKLNINIDMIAGSKKTKKLRYISSPMAQLVNEQQQQCLAKLRKKSSVKIVKGFRSHRTNNSLDKRTNWRMASDHGVFAKQDIPYIYFGIGTHKNYHSVSDSFENINVPFYLSAATSIYQQLRFIDLVI
ncbi:M28 family peptidase [Litorilituus sediminis]|uniref:M28 family peptidase n=1 Tax=Litorilituus sediminis TaxID=718192 RepID=A0A4P6P0I2_9GAMM|nr:M28 family peptidase [Litorilituus sediminis]QBG34606.1 M28 family peptidase [Litorilituus sediminis]